jgi:hypothetical protein
MLAGVAPSPATQAMVTVLQDSPPPGECVRRAA